MKKLILLLCLVPGVVLAADAPPAAKKAPVMVAAPTPKAPPKIPGVDWNAKTIKATGRGAPALNAPSVAAARIGAERAAEMDALRNILSTLQGVRLSSDKTVGDALKQNDSVRSEVEGQARGFKRVETRYFSDGGVEIDVEMTLEGLMGELLGEAETAAEQTQEAVKLPSSGEMKNSGLVIDAKGLKAAPALAPRILDEAGKEVYAATVVTKDALKANGIAGYLKTLGEAKKNARVGDKPLVVKAVKLAGASDLVISNADAEKLRDPKGNVTYLAEGRVIIVSD